MATLVIKNLPAPLHEQLKAQAERNHRSLTKEVIRLLESGLVATATRKPLPAPINLRSARMQTINEIEAAINDGLD